MSKKNEGPVHIRLAMWDWVLSQHRATKEEFQRLEVEYRRADSALGNQSPEPEQQNRRRERLAELRGLMRGYKLVATELKDCLEQDLVDDWEEEFDE